MIAVNNRRDSVSPPPLTPKPKKGKSRTVTPTLPKSQGPKASGALSKKRKNPKSKKPPTETKRNIQLASTGFPSTLDEGIRKSKPLPKGTITHSKDSRGNDQPLDWDLTFKNSDEGMAKTMPRPEGSRGDKDLGGNKPLADMEPQNPTDADLLGTVLKVRTPSPKQDKPELSHVQESSSDSSSLDLKRITEKQWEQHKEATVSYANLKASIDQYYDKNIAHIDQTDKHVEASMSSLDRSSTTISDLYKGMDVITQLLKDISIVIKDDPAANQKINKATK
ncbi:hypothetical protein Tco_1496491, partial [Tanacetum coccineum]